MSTPGPCSKCLSLTIYYDSFFTVDAWAKSGEGVIAAQRAEAILQSMYDLYQKTGKDSLRPTTGIFNAVINAWARSKEKAAPARAEQILQWMDNLHRSNPTIQVRPDKFTYNTGKCIQCSVVLSSSLVLIHLTMNLVAISYSCLCQIGRNSRSDQGARAFGQYAQNARRW